MEELNSYLIIARTTKAMIPKIHPVDAKASGSAKAPAPTIRLKT